MKTSLNKETLAYQFGMRPATQHRDMSCLPLQPISPYILKVMNAVDIYDINGCKLSTEYNGPVCASPEVDALVFYLLNHAMSVIRQKVHVYEPLGKYMPLVERYHVDLAVRASRMFCYLLLICTRESRHDKSQPDSPWATESEITYGPKIMDFHTSIKGLGSTDAYSKYLAHTPETTIGEYSNFLVDVFRKGKYTKGYGGEAWAKIACVLRDYVHGKLSAEMMLDTAFTLAHNNGPIFNKGMLFENYTSDIYTILDVQRSGQVPQLIASKVLPPTKNAQVQLLWNKCVETLGDAFKGYVDWFMVEELGSVNKYPSNKQKQVELYGYPSKYQEKMNAEAAKQELQAKKKMEDLKNAIEIFPGQFIYKIERTA